MGIPKIFWAYYDLFRRKQITIAEFSKKTGLSKQELHSFLQEISENSSEEHETLDQI